MHNKKSSLNRARANPSRYKRLLRPRSVYYSETKPHKDRNVAGLKYDKKPAQEFAKWIYQDANNFMERNIRICGKISITVIFRSMEE